MIGFHHNGGDLFYGYPESICLSGKPEDQSIKRIRFIDDLLHFVIELGEKIFLQIPGKKKLFIPV